MKNGIKAQILAATLASASIGSGDLLFNKPQPERLKPARGRGNQGDWKNSRPPAQELPEHKDWNAEVERKKSSKGKSSKGRIKKMKQRQKQGRR